MAKVMISVSDDLLARIDRLSEIRGTTRSGLLQDLAERELRSDVADKQQFLTQMFAKHAGVGDGRAAEWVRHDRNSR